MEIGPAHIEALALAEGLEARPAHLERVARVVGEDLSRWAFGQWALRARAAARFDQAHLMLFTAEALEQATHPAVAAYHATLFPAGQLVVDCTCGIGSDLIAFAQRGPALGFDLDPERVAYAQWNLAALGLSGEVVLGSSLSVPWSARFAYADPARRVGGRRTLRLSEFTPSIPELVARFAELEVGLLKLSPACDLIELCSLGSVEMVSFGRQCREALVRVGGDGRSAYHVESGATWWVSPSRLGGEGAHPHPVPSGHRPLPALQGEVSPSPSPREGEVDPRSGDGGGNPDLPPSPTASGLPPLGGEDFPQHSEEDGESPSSQEGGVHAKQEQGAGILGLEPSPSDPSEGGKESDSHPVARYIAELDPALARWGAEPGRMLAHDLMLADQPTESPWLRWYRIEAEMDLQHTKAWLRERGEALDAVKPRNIDLEPRSFELKVNPKGAPRKWVAIIIGGKPKTKVFICHRLP